MEAIAAGPTASLAPHPSIVCELMTSISADQMDLENEETPSPDESAAEGPVMT